ncbi:MAG: hypothetical protein KKI09_14245 [Spirochaetes bacterium]|nr:hypothetical protein [Spirochaetota bacterium]MBU0956588.1 hypothetical protein [Spirochaetota bacterium]
MYCGLDLGSSSLKGLLVDASGRQLAWGKAEVRISHDGSRYHSDPLEWEQALISVFGQLTRLLPGGSASIRAIAISGNGPTLVPVGHDGRPLGSAAPWLDRDAATQAARIQVLADQLPTTGPAVDPSFYLPKVLRFVDEHPAAAGQLRYFFSAPEYLAYQLGADPVSYLADPYYDRFVWFSALHAGLGLDPSWFPDYVRPGQTIGRVSAAAAAKYGISAGTVLAAGFPDFLSALVGSGTVQPGLVCDRSGSSEALNLCTKAPLEGSGLFNLPHALPGLWNSSGGVSASGRSLAQVRQLLGFTTVDQLLAAAEESQPGARGLCYLPFPDGERAPLWDSGLRAAWIGLDSRHSRADMARAVAEGIVFGLRLSLQAMQDAGAVVDEIRLSGAAARNDFICRLKADIWAKPLRGLGLPESECSGAACACACALGDAADLREAAGQLVHPAGNWEPVHPDNYTGSWELFQAALAREQTARKRNPA